MKHEGNYAEVYELRRKILAGEIEPSMDLLVDFDNRAEELKDADYEGVETNPVDVKDI